MPEPNEKRKLRDKIYQRKRRLRRQFLSGKISQAQMDEALNAYALNLGLLAMVEATTPAVPLTQPIVLASADIPPHIQAMLEAAIEGDLRAPSCTEVPLARWRKEE